MTDSQYLGIALIEAALAQGEPVGVVVKCNDYGYPWKRIAHTYDSTLSELPIGTKLYTAPPAPVQGEPDRYVWEQLCDHGNGMGWIEQVV